MSSSNSKKEVCVDSSQIKGSVKGMGDCSIKITDIVNKINKEIKEEKSISSHNLPIANKDKTYKHDILCKNCQKIIWLVIPYEKTVDDYLEENKICPECGCDLE